jgi:hypothetical protein
MTLWRSLKKSQRYFLRSNDDDVDDVDVVVRKQIRENKFKFSESVE